MTHYSPERKEALLRQLLPPVSRPVHELAKQEGVPASTLHTWRLKVRRSVPAEPINKRTADWPAGARFAVVMESSRLTEIELSEYCRSKGLYPEQVKAWRQACIEGQDAAKSQHLADQTEIREAKKRIKELERELRRKEKALAETAALLVLRKKYHAYLGLDDEEE